METHFSFEGEKEKDPRKKIQEKKVQRDQVDQLTNLIMEEEKEENEEEVDEKVFLWPLSLPACKKNDLFVYKVVRIGFKRLLAPEQDFVRMGLFLDPVVLLKLRLPSKRSTIFHVMEQEGRCALGDLHSDRKYVTDYAEVVGAQLLVASVEGVNDHHAKLSLTMSLSSLISGRAILRSMFDPDFYYPLGGQVIEPTAGHRCGKGNCGPGLYFGLSPEYALQYWSGSAEAINLAKKLKHTPLILSFHLDPSSFPCSSQTFLRLNGGQSVKGSPTQVVGFSLPKSSADLDPNSSEIRLFSSARSKKRWRIKQNRKRQLEMAQWFHSALNPSLASPEDKNPSDDGHSDFRLLLDRHLTSMT